MGAYPIRTQIYLDRTTYERLQLRSQTRGVSMAKQIREAVERFLAGEEGEPLPRDPIWDLPDLARGFPGSGLGDASTDPDKYLYPEEGE